MKKLTIFLGSLLLFAWVSFWYNIDVDSYDYDEFVAIMNNHNVATTLWATVNVAVGDYSAYCYFITGTASNYQVSTSAFTPAFRRNPSTWRTPIIFCFVRGDFVGGYDLTPTVTANVTLHSFGSNDYLNFKKEYYWNINTTLNWGWGSCPSCPTCSSNAQLNVIANGVTSTYDGDSYNISLSGDIITSQISGAPNYWFLLGSNCSSCLSCPSCPTPPTCVGSGDIAEQLQILNSRMQIQTETPTWFHIVTQDWVVAQRSNLVLPAGLIAYNTGENWDITVIEFLSWQELPLFSVYTGDVRDELVMISADYMGELSVLIISFVVLLGIAFLFRRAFK